MPKCGFFAKHLIHFKRALPGKLTWFTNAELSQIFSAGFPDIWQVCQHCNILSIDFLRMHKK